MADGFGLGSPWAPSAVGGGWPRGSRATQQQGSEQRQRSVEELEKLVLQREETIRQLEAVVLRLQDLVLEGSRGGGIAGESTLEVMHRLLSGAEETRKLDVVSNSSFAAPPESVFVTDTAPQLPAVSQQPPPRIPTPVVVQQPRPVALQPPLPSFLTGRWTSSAPRLPAEETRASVIPDQPRPSSSQQRGANVAGTSLREMGGQILMLTKYQAGCRFIQKQLESSGTGSPDVMSVVLDDLDGHLVEVLTDECGQYMIPKFVQYASPVQRSAIVSELAPTISSTACDPCGSHGLQRMLPYLGDAQAQQLARALEPHLEDLSKDTKGNYLVQSFLKTFGPGPRVQWIHDIVIKRLLAVSKDKVGCTVVCRCLDRADAAQLERLISAVIRSGADLVADVYGNYVTQHVTLQCPLSHSLRFIQSMCGRIGQLCLEKYGSNVLEKMLERSLADPPTFDRLLSELSSPANLIPALCDQYGNYVVQKALDLSASRPDQHSRLVTSILAHLPKLVSESPYAVHIQKKLLRV